MTAGYTVLLCGFPRGACSISCSALLLTSVSSFWKTPGSVLSSINPPSKRHLWLSMMPQGSPDSSAGSSPLRVSCLYPGLWLLETCLQRIHFPFHPYGPIASHCPIHSLLSTCQNHDDLLTFPPPQRQEDCKRQR